MRKHAARRQYGALPYRYNDAGGIEFLLVTSRDTQRWVIPKGWPIKGLKPAKAAAREAFEEAGVRGAVSEKPIGVYGYDKRLDDHGAAAPCEVRVFPLLVKRESDTWPESHQRRSRWFTPIGAARVVHEADLKAIIKHFAAD